jgi:hypothetical protein
MRELSHAERELVEFLLTADVPGREVLVRQSDTARTSGSSCSCGCPSYSLDPDRGLPAAPMPVGPIDAHGKDPGGNDVGVLLFVNDGFLDDVEIFSLAGSTFAGVPRVSDLKLSEWSAPDHHGARTLLNP